MDQRAVDSRTFPMQNYYITIATSLQTVSVSYKAIGLDPFILHRGIDKPS